MQEVEEGEDGENIVESDGRYYKIDESVYEAMVLSGNPKRARSIAKLIGAMGAQTATGKLTMVQVNPYFPLRNYPRDIKTFMVKGLMDMTGLDKDISVKRAVLLAGKYAAQKPGGTLNDIQEAYERRGGGHNTRITSSQQMMDSPIKRAKKRIGRKKAFGDQDLNPWEKMVAGMEKIQTVNELVENAPRIGAFHATLQGLGFADDNKLTTPYEQIPDWAMTRAMSNAMEATVNFARRGEWAHHIEPFFLFYNAAIQGSWYSQGKTVQKAWDDLTKGEGTVANRVIRNRIIVNQALGLTAKASALMAMAAMTVTITGEDGEEEERSLLESYYELPDWMKENDDVILMNIPGYGQFNIKIPKEREWALVSRGYETIIQQALHAAGVKGVPAALEPDDLTRLDVKNEVFESLYETLFERLPITGGTAPTLVQLGTGYDFFRGERIEGKWDDQKEIEERFGNRTSTAAKYLSKSGGARAGFSPKEIDFIIRNTLGSGLFKMSDLVTDAISGKVEGKNIPLVGPLLVDSIPRQAASDIYVKSTENAQKVNSWKAGKKVANIEKVLEDEVVLGVTQSVNKAIRDTNEMSDLAKANYQTGLARWALGRDAVAGYPNPLVEYKDLPTSVREAVAKAVKGLGKKPRLDDKTEAGVKRFKQRVVAKKAAAKKFTKLKKEPK
jgi:hypothetical protein